MSTTDSLPEEEDSILNNLSKTRQLWNSKADLGPTNFLFPKSPGTPTSAANRNRFPSQSESTPTEIVRADEQVVEDYELPDITSMKSQFESKAAAAPVPLPVQKPAKAKETKRHSMTSTDGNAVPVPVNREEQQEETYEVELGKLKAQFESASKNSVIQPKSPQRNSMSKAAIQEHVSRSKVSTNKKQHGKKVVKKTRFEDEVVQQQNSVVSSELRAESDAVAVDLSSLKSQFEGRKDEHLVTPVTLTPRKKTPAAEPPAVENAQPIEIVRAEDQVAEEHYEVELGALKKRFEMAENTQQQSAPKPKAKQAPVVVKATKKEPEVKRDVEATSEAEAAEMEDSPRVETVKSYEPVYEEMIGEETVKDRLQRYKSMAAESTKTQTSVQRIPSQKKVSAPPVAKEPASPAKQDKVEAVESPRSPTPTSLTEIEIVRSPPAGTKITPDYVPSVDLTQTKALFEKDEPKPAERKSSLKRPSSAASTESPPRIGRSSQVQSPPRRNSNYHSSASPSSRSARSSSPKSSSQRVRSISVNSSTVDSDSEMSQVVRPPPAGTKEQPDYVPSLKISSVKSMFEKPKTETSPTSSGAPRPRRQINNSSWVNGNDPEANKTSEDGGRKIVAEGSYEERAGGVVRPPTAGTKERPAYSLSSDFLKSRAAMFEAPQDKGYQPRNKVQSDKKAAPADVVNQSEEKEVIDYALNPKDTKKMFENGEAVSPAKPAESKHAEVIQTPQGELVRPPPAGTRDDSDIVPASDLGSAKKLFEQGYEEPEPAPRKEQIDIQQEAAEAVSRDKEVQQERAYEVAEDESKGSPVAESESDTEGEYLLDKDQNQAPAEEPAQEQQEEEAAAVTPVRVAVPDSPEPEQQEESQYQEEPAQEEPEQESAPEETQAQEYEAPAEEYAPEVTPPAEEPQEQIEASNVIIEDHLLKSSEDAAQEDQPASYEEQPQEEYTAPEQEEESKVAENIIIDDHLLRTEEPATNGVSDSTEDEQENKESYEQVVEKQATAVTENGGTGIAQEAGKKPSSRSSSNSSVDDIDKPHFKYPYELEQTPEKPQNDFDSLLLQPKQEAPAAVDLLNGFGDSPDTSQSLISPAVDTKAPAATFGADDPFGLFDAPPMAAGDPTPPAADPFDIFSTPVVNSTEKNTSKDPFDLFL